jgi:hypothetical protein
MFYDSSCGCSICRSLIARGEAMEEFTKQKTSKLPRADERNRVYERPRLIRYGDVAKLTEAAAQGSIDDLLSLGMKFTGQLG